MLANGIGLALQNANRECRWNVPMPLGAHKARRAQAREWIAASASVDPMRPPSGQLHRYSTPWIKNDIGSEEGGGPFMVLEVGWFARESSAEWASYTRYVQGGLIRYLMQMNVEKKGRCYLKCKSLRIRESLGSGLRRKKQWWWCKVPFRHVEVQMRF